jgi:uncharacterized protein
MPTRTCTRCRKPYDAPDPLLPNAAASYAPFCSKRCADVDLVHWLKGEYVIDGSGGLSYEDEAEAGGDTRTLPLGYHDEDEG